MTHHATRQPWKPALGAHSTGRNPGGIYSAHQLRDLVGYEQARADRTGQHLSLVLCDVSKLGKNDVGHLVDEFSRSVRKTDHLGWFGKSKIGMLLPLTGADGAQQFLSNLKLNGARGQVGFAVHTYPDAWKHAAAAEPGVDTGRCVFTRQVPVWKRTLDLVGSAVGITLLAPLFLLVALYIKIVSPGPVFYRQQRVGLGRREFTFLKFRSMHYRNDEQVHSHHAKDFINFDKPMTKLDAGDPRIIPGGRILRKLAVDELPQLFNVFRGDMSLVGPRPCIPYEANEYQQWHSHRFSILPGLTGLWQVSGKNRLTFQQMIRLDITYENKMSLWFDLWIILRTFPTVVGLGLEGLTGRFLPRSRIEVCEAGHPDSAVGMAK